MSQSLYQKFDSSLDVNGPDFFKSRVPEGVVALKCSDT